MKNVIELDQDEIITAISCYLEGQGASADVGTIKFAFDGRGEVLATLEGDRAEQEDDVLYGKALHRLEKRLPASFCVALSMTAAPETDSFTGAAIPKGVAVLWIEGEGITRAPLERWPEHLRARQRDGWRDAKKGATSEAVERPVAGRRDLEVDGLGHETVLLARVQRDSVDVFTEKELPQDARCLGILAVGITAVHPVEWPEKVKEAHPLTDEQLAQVGRWLWTKKEVRDGTALEWPEHVRSAFHRLQEAGIDCKMVICAKSSEDVVTGETVRQDTRAFWIADVGITVAPLERILDEVGTRVKLPEHLMDAFDRLQKTGTGAKKPATEASTASDILGGDDEDVLDRSAALEAGVGASKKKRARRPRR